MRVCNGYSGSVMDILEVCTRYSGPVKGYSGSVMDIVGLKWILWSVTDKWVCNGYSGSAWI